MELHAEQSTGWSVVSGGAWALATWVSAYEPVVLFLFILAISLVQDRRFLFAKSRRAGWIVFAGIIASSRCSSNVGFVVIRDFAFNRNSSKTGRERLENFISVSVLDPIWFHWAGCT